jgi:predicted amidohydrolase
MRIAAVQSRPVPGDVGTNLERHLRAIDRAAAADVGLVAFPELSLTGYEPALAAVLAMLPGDRRLDPLQRASDGHGIAVAVGLPLAGPAGVRIGMGLFRPGGRRTTFAKRHLHRDEEPFFVPGEGSSVVYVDGTRLAFAICYELSVPEHQAQAAADGAQVYVASVAKTAAGVAEASRTLAGIAERHRMTVLMANCVGPCDDGVCAGRSAAWAPEGGLLAQLPADEEGLLVLDTQTGVTSKVPVEPLPA